MTEKFARDVGGISEAVDNPDSLCIWKKKSSQISIAFPKLTKDCNKFPFQSQCTVDGQMVPDVYRRLICLKVSVSHNLFQKVIPSDEDFSCLYPTLTSEVITFR